MAWTEREKCPIDSTYRQWADSVFAIQYGILMRHIHAAIETNSVTHSWRSVFSLVAFLSKQRIFFLLIKKNFRRLINSYLSQFRWSRRMHWPIFVIDTVCIALAFVVFVDGGGHIYLSFSSYGARCYCCHTILSSACSQREPYYTLGRLSSELILLKSDSCSFRFVLLSSLLLFTFFRVEKNAFSADFFFFDFHFGCWPNRSFFLIPAFALLG